MNTSLLAHLLALRYRLLWASVRVRRGKLVLFFVFYLIVMLVIGFGASGGVKAARLALQTGQAELVAQIVLSGFFSLAMMCAVVLGVGMDSVFSDIELRRYPLSAAASPARGSPAAAGELLIRAGGADGR